MSATVGAAAMERHLKKIYDCLNIGCNKKAVQEVDRLPKNVRDQTVFKALKSLALIRMYKRNQAFEILNEINPEDDLDEVTLQTMTSCYKESVDVGKIVHLYEAASKRKPSDPEIMAHLFMAYVRVFNFKRQKEIALQMFKSFSKKKRLYSFWTIMSLVMQAQEEKRVLTAQDEADRKICLTLAEKMCEKMIDDERSPEEIELYLIILRKQNKHEEEYKFLTGPICLRITDHLSWFNRRRAYLCLDLKMYSRAFKHYFPSLIQEYPDQIEYYEGLFKSAYLLDTEASSQQQSVVLNEQQGQSNSASGGSQVAGTPVKSTSALVECFDIVEKQCLLALEPIESKDQGKTKVQSNAISRNLSRTSSLNPNRKRLLRGPFMAKLQLYYTVLSNQNTLPKNVYNSCLSQFMANYPTLNSLLLDYFQAFSKKIICYHDLDYMINLFKLTSAERQDLLKAIGDWVKDIEKNQTDISPYDLYHVLLNYHMLVHSVHDHKTSDLKENRLNMAKKFIDVYDENRQLGKNTNKTEFQPVDNYCLLAVNSIMTNAIDTNDPTNHSILSDSTIVTLIVLVENAIANSPTNHQLKLCLLKLYSFVGASKQCSDVLLSIDIKHFQIDTLGHLLNPVLYNTGNYNLSKESLETCLEFYAHGVRECFEGLTTSYRDGRFSKIEEISNVLRRLTDSLNATQCVLLKSIVSNLNAATSDELISAAQSFDPFKSLHRMFRDDESAATIKDSRDFKVLKSLHFETNELIRKRQSQTMQDEQVWLRLRYYLIRCAYIQLEMAMDKKHSKKAIADMILELSRGKSEVETLSGKIEELISDSDQRYSYLEPEPTPFRWKHIDLRDLLLLVKPIVFLSDAQQMDSKMAENYSALLDSLMENLEHQLASIDSMVKMKQVLSSLTIAIEFISICGTSLISLVSAASTNMPVSSNLISNASSKPVSQTQPQAMPSKTRPIPHQMMNKTEAHLTKLSGLIKNIDPKSMILDKVASVDEALLSESKHTRLETKSGPLSPIMSNEVVQITFAKVKERIVESYCESLREIENTCRRKAKLLRITI